MKSVLFVALAIFVKAATPVRAQNAQNAPDPTPFNWQIRLKAGQTFRTTIEQSSKMTMQMPNFPGAPAKTTEKTTEKTPDEATAATETNSTSRMVFD